MIQIRCDEGFQGLINEKRIRNILKDFLNRLFDSQRGISVLITNDAEIQKLNKQFRKKDYPTDILSWTYDVVEDEIEEVVIQEEIEEDVVEDEIEEVVIQDEIRQGVRDLFGLGDEDPSLDVLLMPPLDVRIQRLGRIAIILERGNTGPHRALQARLPSIAKKLEDWTAERLSRRHAASGQGLLMDAKALGERLADIPGPGAAMPLDLDRFKLPDTQDLEGLTAAIKRLEKSVMLPSAMVQMPEPVES